jgi:hypothetical protein
MSQPYSKKITFEIVSKGRKYFKIRYSPEHNEFQLLINEISKKFQVGQTITDLLCEFETKVNSYTGGKKTTAIPVDEKIFAERAKTEREAEKKRQIKRWRGYVEDKLLYNQIYTKGLEELKDLGFDISVYKDRIAKVKEINRQSEISRWSGYVEAAAIEGRTYHKGLQKLQELGAPEIAEQFRKQIAEYQSKLQEKKQIKIEQEQEQERSKGIIDYWFGSPAWRRSEELTHLEVGDIYKDRGDGNYYKILTRSRRYVPEDGLSFGLADDQGEIVSGKARLATPEESATLIAAEESERLEQEKKRAIAVERKALADHIKNHGTNPQHNVGDLLLSTVNLYGGGDWFEIDREAGEIWYCRNNGNDGDNWSLNNVVTWGAGAIGWRIEYDEAIANRIKILIEQEETI